MTINLDKVILIDEDLIAIDEKKNICLLREGELYKINASLHEIIDNTKNVSIQYMHKLDLNCERNENKQFLSLKVIREVYDTINKGYQEGNLEKEVNQ